jgi:glycosyl transferase family 25
VIPVLVLNLPRDSERRAWIGGHLRALGVSFEIADAIDGRAIPDHEAAQHRKNFRRHHGREATPGEIGCALSHLRLFRLIADGADEFVCTMEDDVELSSKALPLLDERTLRSLPPFDVLRLYSIEHRQDRLAWEVSKFDGRGVVAPLRAGWGLYTQVLTRAGAEKIADLPITGPIDNMVYFDRPPFGLRILEIRPGLVRRLDLGSNMSGRPAARIVKSLHDRMAALRRDILLPARAWLNFAMTWGPSGCRGLLRSRYRPPQALTA